MKVRFFREAETRELEGGEYKEIRLSSQNPEFVPFETRSYPVQRLSSGSWPLIQDVNIVILDANVNKALNDMRAHYQQAFDDKDQEIERLGKKLYRSKSGVLALSVSVCVLILVCVLLLVQVL